MRTAKLTWRKVDGIRRLWTVGHSTHKQLAKRYKVSESAISDIIHRRTWKPEHDPRRKTQKAAIELLC